MPTVFCGTESEELMIYNVLVFEQFGHKKVDIVVEATNFYKAFIEAMEEKYFGSWWHIAIINKNLMAKRFDNTMKPIKNPPSFFKQERSGKHSILVMFGKHPEFYTFETEKERNEAFDKCSTFTLAESVNQDKEPKDTTVFSGVMLGSKNGSTSKKTLNGYAQPATWMEGLTHFDIAKTSGIVKSKYMDEPTWSAGSNPSPSKHETIFATVKALPDNWSAYPGINSAMKNLEGQTIAVKYSHDNNGTKIYEGEGWSWSESWLDFYNLTLKVKKLELYQSAGGVTVVENMLRNQGEVMNFHPCKGSRPVHYASGNWCYAFEWLETLEAPKKSYANFPKSSMSSEEIAELHTRFTAIYPKMGKKPLMGIIDPRAT